MGVATWLVKVRGILSAVFMGAVLAQSTMAADALTKGAIFLLQPEAIIGTRVGGAAPMADYITKIFAVLDKRLATLPGQSAASGSIFIAVHPGKHAHAWAGFEPPLSGDTAKALTKAVESVPAMTVKGGTVVFALNIGLWGGTPPTQSSGPMPDAWKAASDGKTEVSVVADRAWAADDRRSSK